jgi:hypothetical protein
MKTRMILLLIGLSLTLYLPGQTQETIKPKAFGVGVVPQYSISSGTRIDFDFRLRRPGHWLVVAPQFYMDNGNNSINRDIDQMVGFGIELQHKIFFRDTPEPKGAYLAYGPVFQYRSVKAEGLAAYNFEENGTEYIGLTNDMNQTGIFKYGANLICGLQTVVSEFFYIDVFIGTGIRLSFDNRTSGLHGYYNNGWIDYGYSGTLLVGGIRFGISL